MTRRLLCALLLACSALVACQDKSAHPPLASTVITGSTPYYAPGTPPYNPSWYSAATLYWDPAGTSGGSDSNSCTASGSPCLTWGEIVRRYGSDSPTLPYGTGVTVTQLTSQAAGVDPVFFQPRITGGAQAALIGTLTVAHAAFTAGTITQPSKTAGGTLLTVASMPAGTSAATLVYNSTRNSYAFVDSMASSTASMQQPLPAGTITTITASPATSVDSTWTTGDTLITYSLPTVNLKRWQPLGGDLVGSSFGVGWVQWEHIVDPSGAGTSVYQLGNEGIGNSLSSCEVDSRLHISSLSGRGDGTNVIGSTMLGGGNQVVAGIGYVFGGGLASGLTASGSMPQIFSVTMHGALRLFGAAVDTATIDELYSDGSITIQGATAQLTANGSDYKLWGSYSLTLNPMGVLWNNTGQTWVNTIVTSGAIKQGSNTSACGVSGTTFTCSISITPTNIDSNGGLQDLATGARFCNSQ